MFAKLCTECKLELPEASFYRSSQDVLSSACKPCSKARALAYRAKNIKVVRAYDRQRGQLPHRKEILKARQHRYAAKHAARVRDDRVRRPEKYQARTVLGNAVRDGRIVKPAACERCHREGRLHGHHENHAQPLDVDWLCSRCHGERHREINEQLRTT